MTMRIREPYRQLAHLITSTECASSSFCLLNKPKNQNHITQLLHQVIDDDDWTNFVSFFYYSANYFVDCFFLIRTIRFPFYLAKLPFSAHCSWYYKGNDKTFRAMNLNENAKFTRDFYSKWKKEMKISAKNKGKGNYLDRNEHNICFFQLL